MRFSVRLVWLVVGFLYCGFGFMWCCFACGCLLCRLLVFWWCCRVCCFGCLGFDVYVLLFVLGFTFVRWLVDFRCRFVLIVFAVSWFICCFCLLCFGLCFGCCDLGCLVRLFWIFDLIICVLVMLFIV